MADLGTGATVAFATSAGVALADITNIDWSGATRESIDTSHMGTSLVKTAIVSTLVEPGELSVDYLVNTNQLGTESPFIFDNSGHQSGTITVTMLDQANATVATWTSTGAMTAWSSTAPMEGVITGNFTFKLSGAPTFTDSA